jgi:hypothetical protein
MMSDTRKMELQQIAENESRRRGFNSGSGYLKKTYAIWKLTDEEAQAVGYLIQNADIAFPAFPHHLV